MGRRATMLWVPVDREENPWPLGIVEVGWGFSSNTWWAPQEQRVWKPLPNKSNPLQKQITTNSKPMGHNPRVDLCPQSIKKMKKKMKDFEKMGFREKWGESGENEQMGGRRWVKWPERDRRWFGGGGFVVGDGDFWILGSDWEERMEKKGGEVYGRYRRMRGMGKKMT
jgi:hypothetical protein